MNHLAPKVLSTLVLITSTHAMGDETEVSEIITEMADTISENYVFPDMGLQIHEMLMTSLKSGEYDNLQREELAQTLEMQIRDLTHDLHFGVRPLPEGWEPPSEEDNNASIQMGPSAPFGFNSVQRLDGNIGYVELRGFVGAMHIEDTLKATMQLLQGSNSIIFDLRQNGGGDPAAVQLISSYLFDPSEPIHLNSLYYRPDDRTTEFWTHDRIDTSLAMPDVPVYVLTSGRTFSAAEEFTYNLKNLERATIIGETTGGGAHPVDSVFFGNQLMVVLPIARAINPISGTNWEGTGVSPHFETRADDALDTAIFRSLEQAFKDGDESVRWGLANYQAKNNPITCSPEDLQAYAGDYGPRHVRIHEGGLEYRRDGNPNWTSIICFKRDQFVIQGLDGFIMNFERDDSGTIVGIAGDYDRGGRDFSARD
tara:strand:- start:771248 stop:772522 length:1275 start_codon:yes stop_codon:yes gene_type:complete